jgi:hypothetical protein
MEADFHEALTEMLQSVNFATFNLNFIKVPFVEKQKEELQQYLHPNRDTLLETRMQKAGFEDNLFIADYMYFFIYLAIFMMCHLFFKLFINVPIRPKTKFQNFIVTVYRYFTFSCYTRLFLECYFFMVVAAFVEFKAGPQTPTEIISATVAALCFTLLQAFTVYTIIHYILWRNTIAIIGGKNSVLYEGLKGDSWSKLYSSFFLVRRLTLAVFLVFVRDSSAQISIFIILQFSALLYLCIIRPFDSLQDNIINLLNETSTLV